MHTNPNIDIGALRSRLGRLATIRQVIFDGIAWLLLLAGIFLLCQLGGCGAAKPQTVFNNCVIIDSPPSGGGGITIRCDANAEQNEKDGGIDNGQAAK